jgi:hypothetical protein
MTCGLGVLLDLKHLVFILTLHCWLSVIFYRTHIHHAKISAFIKITALLGFFSLTLTISTLWFIYFGQGLIKDIELFWYRS